MILDSSEKAATLKTVKGWVSSKGHFYGDNEQLARWDGCTHQTCECGKTYEKGWTICGDCRDKSKSSAFESMERKIWDYVTPLTLHDGDEYFFDEDELANYLDINSLHIRDLDLVICEPIKMPTLDEAYFLDELHEGAEMPQDIAIAIEGINKLINNSKPQTWRPGKFAASIPVVR